MLWSHSPSSNASQVPPPQRCALFYLNPEDLFVLPNTVGVVFHWRTINLPGASYTLGESFFFFPKQLTASSSAMVGGSPFPPHLSMLEFGPTWACPAFVFPLEGGSEHSLPPILNLIYYDPIPFEAPLTLLSVRETNQASIFLLKLTTHLAWLFLARTHLV